MGEKRVRIGERRHMWEGWREESVGGGIRGGGRGRHTLGTLEYDTPGSQLPELAKSRFMVPALAKINGPQYPQMGFLAQDLFLWP